MLSTLLRIAREGSLLAVLGVTLLSAPLAEAQPRSREGRRDAAPVVRDDKGPGALDYAVGIASVFDPRHDLGKLALGGLLFGAAPMVALIPPPVGIVGAVVVGAVGLGLLSWGAYNINKSVAEAPTTRPTQPGNGGGTTAPGGTTTTPGNAPGNGGNNGSGGRTAPVRVDPPGGIDLGGRDAGRNGSNVSRNDDTTTRLPGIGRQPRTNGGSGGGATR